MWILTMTLIASIDCVFAGMAYSARGIRIPFLSKLLLFFTALIIGGIAEIASVALVRVIPSEIAHSLGRIILVLLGLFMLATALFDKRNENGTPKSAGDKHEPRTLFKLVLKSAGITIQILKHYEDADFNQSGKIDPIESVFLSLALTLDCVGLIICGALINQRTLLFPLALSLGQVTGLVLGARLGNLVLKRFNRPFLKYLPAGLLLLAAGMELLQ